MSKYYDDVLGSVLQFVPFDTFSKVVSTYSKLPNISLIYSPWTPKIPKYYEDVGINIIKHPTNTIYKKVENKKIKKKHSFLQICNQPFFKVYSFENIPLLIKSCYVNKLSLFVDGCRSGCPIYLLKLIEKTFDVYNNRIFNKCVLSALCLASRSNNLTIVKYLFKFKIPMCNFKYILTQFIKNKNTKAIKLLVRKMENDKRKEYKTIYGTFDHEKWFNCEISLTIIGICDQILPNVYKKSKTNMYKYPEYYKNIIRWLINKSNVTVLRPRVIVSLSSIGWSDINLLILGHKSILIDAKQHVNLINMIIHRCGDEVTLKALLSNPIYKIPNITLGLISFEILCILLENERFDLTPYIGNINRDIHLSKMCSTERQGKRQERVCVFLNSKRVISISAVLNQIIETLCICFKGKSRGSNRYNSFINMISENKLLMKNEVIKSLIYEDEKG